MKAIVLAAGIGSRISEKIGRVPKSTLPLLDGTPIIRRSVKMMLELNIEPILCIGYEGQKIREALEGLPVRYYENPFYAVTNNVASVWFTLPELKGEQDILLLSGDLYYPRLFLQRALDAEDTLTMFGDSSRIQDGDYFLHLDSDGYIDEYGSELPLGKRQYEYMGFSKIKDCFVKDFAKRLKQYIDRGEYNTYFESVILSFNDAREQRIRIIDVAGEFWREYDYYSDYQLILQHEREGLT